MRTETLAAVLAALLASAAAQAQGSAAATAPKRPDPLDAQAATVPLVQRSAFGDYKKHSAESPPLAWRDANDAVERIGGWRAYAREAAAPPPTAGSAPQPARGPQPAAPAQRR